MKSKNNTHLTHQISISFFCALSAITFLTFFASCSKDPNKSYEISYIKTHPATEITDTSAKLIGEVIPDQRGLEYTAYIIYEDQKDGVGAIGNYKLGWDFLVNMPFAKYENKLERTTPPLKPNHIYLFRTIAKCPIMNYSGEMMMFTTTGPIELNTNHVTNFTKNTASVSGTIVTDGGTPITEKGVCYSTTNNPTTASSKSQNTEAHKGNFDTKLVGLSPNTTYYAKAYAINARGTVYGAEVSFTTLP